MRDGNRRLLDIEREIHAINVRLQNQIIIGTVDAVDPDKCTARVHCGDSFLDCNISMGRAGADRIWTLPSPGEQVVVVAASGNLEYSVIVGSLFRDRFPAIKKEKEVSLSFEDGTKIKYDKVGRKITVDVGSGSMHINAPNGGVTINGNLTVSQTVTALCVISQCP